MPKNYLVTGAAGFIGCCLANKLIEQGNQVITIDNLSTGYESAIPNGVRFIKGDCFDDTIIKQLERYPIDVIFHIAGQSSGEVSFENPEYDLNTNTLSTLKLLQFAKEKGIKRFIYASTMSVYGDHEVQPVDESCIPNPKSYYAVGKLASEQYLKIYRNFGIETIALRLFNVYGPGQNMQNMKQGMLSIFLAQALKDCRILVKGSLERFRDFVFIDDVIEAFLLSETVFQKDFQPINICSGVPSKVGLLIDLIKKNIANEIVVSELSGTPGDQFGIYGDARLAKEVLGWYPKTDLTTGIERMIQWAKIRNDEQ